MIGRKMLALCLLPVLVAAKEPTCTRVPDIGFQRVLVLPTVSLYKSVPLGVSGQGGVGLLREGIPPLAADIYLQVIEPDGRGGVALSPLLALDTQRLFGGGASIAAGDFDADGEIDLAVRTHTGSPARNQLRLYQRQALAKWHLTATLSLNSAGLTEPLLSGDFDGDGTSEVAYQDLGCPSCSPVGWVAARVEDNEWKVLPTATPPSPMELLTSDSGTAAVVDANRDGIDDVARLLLARGNDAIEISYGDPASPLVRRTQQPLGFESSRLVELNRRPVVLEGVADYFGAGVKAIVEFRPGESGLEVAWRLPVDDRFTALYPSLDIDGDGSHELMVGSQRFFFGGLSGTIAYWTRQDAPPVRGPQTATITQVLACPDLNGDGVRDIISSGVVAALRERSDSLDDGAIGSTMTESFVDEPEFFVEVGDLNEDGLDDLLLNSRYVYKNPLTPAISRGDGTFEMRWLSNPEWNQRQLVLRDLDHDGHLDIAAKSGNRDAGWGRGDGSFDEHIVRRAQPFLFRSFGDLNGDGLIDLIEFNPFGFDPSQQKFLSTALSRGRSWPDSSFRREYPAEFVRFPELADLDNDGKADLWTKRVTIFNATRQYSLIYWPSLGDGSFAAERTVLAPADHDIGVVKITDFDLDGVNDVVVFLRDWGTDKVEIRSLRNDGAGNFAEVWRGDGLFSPTSPFFEEVHDVDGDGRPDLMAGLGPMYVPIWTPPPQYGVRVRRGNGLGGFGDPMPTEWGAGVSPLGVFRSNGGRDIVRLNLYRWNQIRVELFPSASNVPSADSQAPTVEISLRPVFDTTHTPPRFAGDWQVITLPSDECDSKPRIEQRVVELLASNIDRVSFRRSEQREIQVFEVPGTTQRELLLRGPDEGEMRALLAAGIASGGFAFQHWGAPVGLASTPAYSPLRGPTQPKSRMIQRFSFNATRMTAATLTRPDDELRFAVTAVDRAGHRGTTRLPFGPLRQQAVRQLCESNQTQEQICQEP